MGIILAVIILVIIDQIRRRVSLSKKLQADPRLCPNCQTQIPKSAKTCPNCNLQMDF